MICSWLDASERNGAGRRDSVLSIFLAGWDAARVDTIGFGGLVVTAASAVEGLGACAP